MLGLPNDQVPSHYMKEPWGNELLSGRWGAPTLEDGCCPPAHMLLTTGFMATSHVWHWQPHSTGKMAGRGTEGSHGGQEPHGGKGKERDSCWVLTLRRLQKSSVTPRGPGEARGKRETWEQSKPLNKCFTRQEIFWLTQDSSPLNSVEYFHIHYFRSSSQ